MAKVSFSTQYVQLSDHINQLRVNLDLFSMRGQKKAAFEARKNLASITKIAKTLRKDLQDAKKAMPTRKRVVKGSDAVVETVAEKPAAPAKKPVVAKKTA